LTPPPPIRSCLTPPRLYRLLSYVSSAPPAALEWASTLGGGRKPFALLPSCLLEAVGPFLNCADMTIQALPSCMLFLPVVFFPLVPAIASRQRRGNLFSPVTPVHQEHICEHRAHESFFRPFLFPSRPARNFSLPDSPGHFFSRGISLILLPTNFFSPSFILIFCVVASSFRSSSPFPTTTARVYRSFLFVSRRGHRSNRSGPGSRFLFPSAPLSPNGGLVTDVHGGCGNISFLAPFCYHAPSYRKGPQRIPFIPPRYR